MTTLTLNTGVSAYVLSTAPNRRHGGVAVSPVDSDQAITYVQMPLGTRIPAGATITSAKLRVYQAKAGTWAVSNTLTAQRVGKWTVSGITWNNRPATSGSAVAVTQSDTANGALWEFDVTADAVAFAAGTATNYGWQITSSSTARRYVRMFKAAALKPVLVVEYAVAPSTPTDLVPSYAATGITKPTLSWRSSSFDTFQVQVDDAADFATPTHDSGSVVSTVAEYDLAGTAYAGNSGTAYWRVRAARAGQWSDWSPAVSWSYDVPPVVTITAPGASTADPSPLATWTAPDQVARRVIYRNAAGTVLEDSGWSTTADLAYAPSVFRKGNPGAYSVEVQVRDAVLREAVPGSPEYGYDVQSYTYTRAVGIDPPTSLVGERPDVLPRLRLSWQRAAAPDGWKILRDGEEVAALDVLDTSTSGTSHQWDDWTATVNREHTWQVLPVVNDETGEGGPSLTTSIAVKAVWLVDVEAAEGVPFWQTSSDVDLGGSETSSVFKTADGSTLRWQHQTYGAEGTVAGLLTDVSGHPDALKSADLLRAWRLDAPASLRLVIPPANLPVVVGDIGVSVSPLDSKGGPVIPADFAFWSDEVA